MHNFFALRKAKQNAQHNNKNHYSAISFRGGGKELRYMNQKGESSERSRSTSTSSVGFGTSGSPSRRSTSTRGGAGSSSSAVGAIGGRNTVTMAVRVYGQGNDSNISHSFIVGDVPTALTAPIGETFYAMLRFLRSFRILLQFYL
jgi:hypothetical protein